MWKALMQAQTWFMLGFVVVVGTLIGIIGATVIAPKLWPKPKWPNSNPVGDKVKNEEPK